MNYAYAKYDSVAIEIVCTKPNFTAEHYKCRHSVSCDALKSVFSLKLFKRLKVCNIEAFVAESHSVLMIDEIEKYIIILMVLFTIFNDTKNACFSQLV